MELIELKQLICSKFTGKDDELQKILAIIEQDKAIFPFNEYEYLICHLMEAKWLTFQQYQDIRMEYMAANPYLWVFEISAPRGFGEKFAQTFICAKSSRIKSASKKLDADFQGEYDLWLDGIKIKTTMLRCICLGCSIS